MKSAYCSCGHVTQFNENSLDSAKIARVPDSDGKLWLVYGVTCASCGREALAGGKDGRGNV